MLSTMVPDNVTTIHHVNITVNSTVNLTIDSETDIAMNTSTSITYISSKTARKNISDDTNSTRSMESTSYNTVPSKTTMINVLKLSTQRSRLNSSATTVNTTFNPTRTSLNVTMESNTTTLSTNMTTSYTNVTSEQYTNNINVTIETTTKNQSFPRQPTNLATSETQSPTHYMKPKQDKTAEFSIESFSGGFAVGVTVTIIVICFGFYLNYKKNEEDHIESISLLVDEEDMRL